MTESILDSIKEMLGVDTSTTVFDSEIIVAINAAFMVLRHLGVDADGSDYFSISTNETTWDEFLGDNASVYEPVKTYIFYRTKLAFDPPSTSSLIDCLKEQIRELAFYLGVDGEFLE